MRFAFALLALVACNSSSETKPQAKPPIERVEELGPLPVAVAIVFNGQEVTAGNTSFEQDEAARYPGWLNALRDGIAKSNPASVLPAGSTSLVVSYATGATVLKPIGPIAELVPEAFGVQKDYYAKVGTDLVVGMDLALGVLERAKQQRRLMIVVGDGNDTNNEVARPALEKLKHRAIAANTRIYALVVRSAVSAEGRIIDTEMTVVRVVSSAEQLADELSAIWREALQR
jgi:hypothetical protein